MVQAPWAKSLFLLPFSAIACLFCLNCDLWDWHDWEDFDDGNWLGRGFEWVASQGIWYISSITLARGDGWGFLVRERGVARGDGQKFPASERGTGGYLRWKA